MIEGDEVAKLAALSRINVSDDELKELKNDIESILEYISQIKDVVSEELIPEVGEHHNVMREDGEPHKPKEYTEKLLNEAPKQQDGYLKVKKILSQD